MTGAKHIAREKTMKKIVREFEFAPEQSAIVGRLSRALGITETTAGILFARGTDTEEKMRRFLNPSAENFLSPFLMSGMKEAAELLHRAREEGWNVAVFGDYDADGIGASAIMYRALKEFGIEPYLYVPERTEGYGMSIRAIDQIFDEFLPDLVITVDCGISNYEEVEYIKEQGALVVVTDHHELPERLPDCVCVNPKIDDDYPYDNLCGAGVAFKLAQALIGERAYRFLDFAALSTVADSVPLLGENRDIVAEGLRIVNKNPRPAFSALLGKNADGVTAQTLAFTVAPRINGAGRMGEAGAALRLFTTDVEGEIFDLAAKLNAYNIERQKCCDDLYAQARAQIAEKGAYGNVIMLAAEEWNAGFVGIVAARVAEEFARPALLFVKRGDMLKGSARSIESVNIFQALKHCSEYIEEFGGHAQAAGINVKAENFAALERALDEYIAAHYTREDFTQRLIVSGEVTGAFPKKLARELDALEPYGVGNRRPLFVLRAGKMNAAPLKPLSPHISVSGEALDFMYFGGGKDLRILRSDLNKQVVFECNLSKFRGKEYLKGFIRALVYDGASGREADEDAFEHALLSVKLGGKPKAELSDTASLNKLLSEHMNACAYGLCAVASERKTLESFPSLCGLDADVFYLSSGSVANAVLVAPAPDCDLSAFREIVFLDKPAAVSVKTGKARVYVNGEISGAKRFRGVSAVREDLLPVFAAIRNAENTLSGCTYSEVARACGSLGFAEEQFVFALSVFDELGLIALENGRVKVFRGKKTELSDSVIFTACARMAEEGC